MSYAQPTLERLEASAYTVPTDCPNALWHLKARLLDLPLVSLLGAVHKSVPVYGSGGFTSYPIERLDAARYRVL